MNPTAQPPSPALPSGAEQFITRWRPSGGAERANYQMFITELCDFLGVPRPNPTTDDDTQNAYTFDRLVTHTRPDGSTTSNWIDCYKRGHFILETKQGIERRAREADAAQALAADTTAPAKRKTGHGLRGTPKWDATMLAARNQAERYARALPPSEGWPPFLIIIDIGHTIEFYSEFSLSGKTYVPYPDPQSFRINLKDLADPAICDRLRLVFSDPLTLDPTRHAARITRDVANHLADLSRSLEASGYHPERTAYFLMRCIFTMFAEDVELIPANGFRDLLRLFTIEAPAAERLSADIFPDLVKDVWHAMDKGVFSAHLKQKLQRFNGGLFADTEVLPLNIAQITLLHSAACCHWREVEPAIFGTLLERALNPKERHKLGAHYTPRAYVERLVLPTVIEPLRDDWQHVLTAAVLEANSDDKNGWKRAVQLCRDFLYQLTQTLVLDPACGTGNFLYVTLEHMKRLEGEVRDAMANFTGSHQAEIEASEFQVDPHQFLGIEINPRAAAIAELVLWIGYLQWQIKALGTTRLPEPVLQDFKNIENRDAVLDYDRKKPLLDPDGDPVTRWDGETKKPHPVTGDLVPDDTARTPVYQYINPRKAQWPMVHYIVGNPPFLGPARMREALGDGYAETLRKVHKDVPESADFVMYWWNKAADTLKGSTGVSPVSEKGSTGVSPVSGNSSTKQNHAPLSYASSGPHLSSAAADTTIRNSSFVISNSAKGVLRRFGFITTNSLRQTFNRRVLQNHLSTGEISLAFAIPDHPWVDSADGAAVRIAMTVAQPGQHPGQLQTLLSRMDTPVRPEPTQSDTAAPTTTPQTQPATIVQPTQAAEGRTDTPVRFKPTQPAPSTPDPTNKTQSDNSDPLGAPASRRPPTQPATIVQPTQAAEGRADTPVRFQPTQPALPAPTTTPHPQSAAIITPPLTFNSTIGPIQADLTVGAAVVNTVQLTSNIGICNRGVQLIGTGFMVSPEQASTLGLGTAAGLEKYIRPYKNGKDITGVDRNTLVIDLFGLSEAEVMSRYPEVYQWIYERVKPNREQNNRAVYRNNWWIFGEPVVTTRKAITALNRYIVTCRTAKHRLFTFLDQVVVPDAKLITIALSDSKYLGLLSSRFHVVWANASGANLGVGNDSNYNHSECFNKFPFPTPTPGQADRIRDIAERLDAHRKRQQQLHPKLTLTDCYNVLEKLRTGEPLTKKDKVIHDHGLVTVLRQLHDDLDAAVAEAYGWPADLTDQEILTRLVDLNTQRAAEEAQGKIRYLRPEYQDPTQRAKATTKPQNKTTQDDLLPEEQPPATKPTPTKGKPDKPPKPGKTPKQEKQPWPKTLPEQAKAVQTLLAELADATPEQVTAMFKGAKVQQVEAIIETLVVLGHSNILDKFHASRYALEQTPKSKPAS